MPTPTLQPRTQLPPPPPAEGRPAPDISARCGLVGRLAIGLAFLLVAGCGGDEERRPNVLLLVVDTLRADALETYGAERATSPDIERLLEQPGVVVDRAYADAPWTLPSMAAALTGLPPSDLTNAAGSPVGIPDAAQTLGELLAEGGYTTAAFVTNATLGAHNGYAQGFVHYQTPPLREALRHHAGQVNEEVLSYLAAGPEEPWFLWVHYLDPHDPYASPDLPADGRSDFYPDYAGELTGDDLGALEVGRKQLTDPDDDLRHLRALYDAEVRFVDRQIGRLLDVLGPETLAHTLVVLTSDHGEEFYEHGGFKHGQTLYEEQLRVPWIWRWDGVLPAGRRVDGPASLLDLVPTVASAVGLRPRDDLPGIDLLPLLRGQGEVAARKADQLRQRTLFFRHLAPGPERLATLRGERKEILFDRHAPFTPSGDVRGDGMWRRDVERMERHEVYDLAVDPGEADPRETDPREGSDAGSAFCRLDPYLQGLRIVRRAVERDGKEGPGEPETEAGTETWTVRLLYLPTADPDPQIDIRPLFLAPEDDVSVRHKTFELRLTPETLPKGALIQADLGSLEAVEISSGGQTWTRTADELRTSACDLGPDSSGDLSGDLSDEPSDEPSDDPSLAVWIRPRKQRFDAGSIRDEMTREQVEALEVLGYAIPDGKAP